MANTPTTLLTIDGRIELSQFWPAGESDADTTKIVVEVAGSGFRIQRPDDAAPRATDVYQRAYLRGPKRGNGFVRLPVAAGGKVIVRLQRVDAPELHVLPAQLRGKSLAGLGWYQAYRQRQAETAVSRLGRFLSKLAGGKRQLACTFTTRLADARGPGDAIDKYGRFVGDLLVGPERINLNLWLLREGWAMLALYESMRADEIDESLAAWHEGAGKGVRPSYRSAFEPFEFVTFRRPGSVLQDDRDNGAFIHPKFFRRYITWWAYHGAGQMEGSFADYLGKRAEKIYRLSEFRAWLDAGGPKPRTFLLFDPRADRERVSWGADEFIFQEAAAELYIDVGRRSVKVSKARWDG
jgi:endonuclease YncB( thermonuclease family)